MSERALKRIPLEKFMDLKVDYSFKQLFGTEKNKAITVVFLNAILKRTDRKAIKEVAFTSQEVGGEYDGDKQSRLDILVRTQEDELINIEVQVTNQYDMVKRTLYYWARVYNLQLKKGKGYHTLLPTITIIICNFGLFDETEKFHNTFHLYEREEQFRMDDVMEIHFIEMNKFIKQWYEKQLDPLDDVLARWLLLLGMVDGRKKKVYNEIYEELEALAMEDKDLQDAFGVWQDLSRSQEETLAYESRLKYIMDEEAKLDDAKYFAQKEGRQKGLEAGIEKGIEKGIEVAMIKVAKKMMKKGESNEEIMDVTDLTLEVVEELRVHVSQ